jgi:hypothetical protein
LAQITLAYWGIGDDATSVKPDHFFCLIVAENAKSPIPAPSRNASSFHLSSPFPLSSTAAVPPQAIRPV